MSGVDRIGDTEQVGDVIHRGMNTTIRRVLGPVGAAPRLVKTLVEGASDAASEALRNELGIDALIEGHGAARVFATRDTPRQLECEDIGGRSLDQLVSGPQPLEWVLQIGIKLAGCLEAIHERGVTHRDLCPAHIVFSPTTGMLRLIDFGLAQRVPRQAYPPQRAWGMSPRLAYRAPEQSGWMNRSVDSRADLWSFGAVLHQLLTGQPPFSGHSDEQLLIRQLGGEANPLALLNAAVPLQLSKLLMRLLARRVEERYQSASGVAHDLSRCLREIEHGSPFPLGERDATATLRLSETLRGRDEAFATLDRALRDAVASGPRLVLISGPSGVGKSTFGREVLRSVADCGGYFISGKFDQLHLDVPYAAVSGALRQLVLQMLNESPVERAAWKSTVEQALDGSGRALTAVIPELNLLIGPQPELPALGPGQERNRFNLLVRRVLTAVCSRERPVVILLDDLQWADAASLALITRLAGPAGVPHLLLVAAYREHEGGRRIRRALAGLDASGAAIDRIVLGDLTVPQLQAWLQDSFPKTLEPVEPLARALVDKTGGNPHFVRELLLSLCDSGALRFQPAGADGGDADGWGWSIDDVWSADAMGTVVELLSHRLSRLPTATLTLLEMAAGIGAVFDPADLAVLVGRTRLEVLAELEPARDAGLLLTGAGHDDPGRDTELAAKLQFSHDRVQQVAHTRLSDAAREALHLGMVRLLLERAKTYEERAASAFDVVSHFEQLSDVALTPSEQIQLAQTHTLAGRRARAGTAYERAASYFAGATALLPEDAWREQYELAFDAHKGRAEAEYLCGNLDQSDRLFSELIARARSQLHRAELTLVRLRLYQVSGQYLEAVELASESLAEFGLVLPAEPQVLNAEVDGLHLLTPLKLRGRKAGDLLGAPVATDANHRMVMELLTGAMPCAYIGRPEAFPWFQAHAINSALEHGNTEASCYAYAVYGMGLVADGEYQRAFEFSTLALTLNERFGDRALKGTLYHLHGDHLNYWSQPIATDFSWLEEGFEACLATGDHVYASFIAFEIIWQMIERGDAIAEIIAASERWARFAQSIHNEPVLHTIVMQQQFLAAWQGRTSSPTSLSDESFDEEAVLAAVSKANFGCGIAFFHIQKQILRFAAGDMQGALESATAAQGTLGAVVAMPIEATHRLFHGLTLCALQREQPTPERDREITVIVQGFDTLAEHCPENFLNKARLLRAEHAATRGQLLEAMRCYEQSIEAARAQGFVPYEAMAQELAARFFERQELSALAMAFRQQARSRYQQWGAIRRLGLGETEEGHSLQLGGSARRAAPFALQSYLDIGSALARAATLAEVAEVLLRFCSRHHHGDRFGLHVKGTQEAYMLVPGEGPAEGVFLRSATDPDEGWARFGDWIATARRQLDETSSQQGRLTDEAGRCCHFFGIFDGGRELALLFCEQPSGGQPPGPGMRDAWQLLQPQTVAALSRAYQFEKEQGELSLMRLAQRALGENQALLQSILEHWPAFVYVRNRAGKYLLVNQHFSQLAGQRASEIEGTAGEALPEAFKEAFSAQDQCLLDKPEVVEGDEPLLGPSGTRTYRTLRFPLSDPKGNFYAFCCIGLEVTDKLALETRLRQAQKLEAMGQLAGGIAHDFNNLLTAIMGNAQLLKAGVAREDDEKSIAEIISAGERAAELTGQLLSYSRAGKIRTVAVNMHHLILEVSSLLSRTLDKRIELSQHFDARGSTVMGDPAQLQSALLNLAVNSRDAMPGGGKLIFKTRTLPAPVDGKAPHGLIEVAVEDTGVGIAPELAQRIFEPYFTTKEVGAGTGLGLASVMGCIESHDGQIEMRSELGKGTSFLIRLPLTRKATGGHASPEAPASVAKQARILIVDDEPSVRNAIGRMLTRAGHLSTLCSGGRQALERFAKGERYDLVVLDLMMPELSGEDTLVELKRLVPDAKVLLCSGYCDSDVAERLVELGALDLLRKPFRYSELTRVVNALL